MIESFAFRALLTLGDWTFKGTAILFIAWVITVCIRNSAAARHLTWVTGFTVLLLLPLATLIGPSYPIIVITQAALSLENSIPSLRRTQMSEASVAEIADGKASGTLAFSAISSATSGEPPTATNLIQNQTRFLIAVLGIWVAGVAVVALQGILALFAIARVRRHGVEGIDHPIDLLPLSGKVGLKRRWRLRTSRMSKPSTPMTWGFIRPVILLPRESVNWSKRRFEVVMLHELAHVRRCDSVSQLLVLAVCALYWFNPVVWLCARALRSEAEMAADDTVLRSGIKPSTYATELLTFAAELGKQRSSFSSVGVFIMTQSRIEARINSIVALNRRRCGLRFIESLSAIAVGLSLVLLLALWQPLGVEARDPRLTNISIPTLTDRRDPFQEASDTTDSPKQNPDRIPANSSGANSAQAKTRRTPTSDSITKLDKVDPSPKMSVPGSESRTDSTQVSADELTTNPDRISSDTATSPDRYVRLRSFSSDSRTNGYQLSEIAASTNPDRLTADQLKLIPDQVPDRKSTTNPDRNTGAVKTRKSADSWEKF